MGGLLAVALAGLVPVGAAHAAKAETPDGTFGRLRGTGDGVTWAVTGSAVDIDTPAAPVTVEVAINNVLAGTTTSDPATHLWATTIPIPVTAGTYYVCVYLVNTDGTGNDPLIGCKTGRSSGLVVTTPAGSTTPVVTPAVPVGNTPDGTFGRLFGDKTTRTWTVTGSMIDVDTPAAPVQVDVYVDGVIYASGIADGLLHGYSITAAMPAVGFHYVCVYGLNTDGTNNNPLIGCKKGTVPAP